MLSLQARAKCSTACWYEPDASATRATPTSFSVPPNRLGAMPPLVPSIELAGLLLEGDTALTLSSGITIGVCQAHMTGQYRSATWISFTPLQF